MVTNADTEVDAVAGEILSYLASHPAAADTMEGIARWWITRQRIEEARERVQHALDALVAAGRLESRVTPAGRALYQLPDAGSRLTGGPDEVTAKPRPDEHN
jgi:hypothetical protein